MYTPEDSPFEKFRTEKLKGVAMSPDVRELVALAYESGFIDGMQKQMQSSVDRAVNAMAEQPARPYRQLQDNGSKYFGESWDKAEQPAQQEPVAYGMWDTMLGKNNRMMMVRLDNGQDGCTVPLYTSPPAQRTWVGLTLSDREKLRDQFEGWSYPAILVDAVSDILKEKNT